MASKPVGIVCTILLLFVVAHVTTVKGLTVFQSGYDLIYCPPDQLCYAANVRGVSGAISIPSQTVSTGNTVAYWVSLDAILPWAHWWMQAGYVLGEAPDGNFYSQPTLYAEYNTDTAYSFHPIGSVPWNSQHTFKITTNDAGSNLNGRIEIDGVLYDNPALPCPLFGGCFMWGNPSARLEVQQSTSSNYLVQVYGTWSNLQFYSLAICNVYCDPGWQPWGWGNLFQMTSVVAIITAPYCLFTSGGTSFTVDYIGGTCGAGGGSGGVRI